MKAWERASRRANRFQVAVAIAGPLVLLVTLARPAYVTAGQPVISEEAVSRAAAARAYFGLPSGHDIVASVMASIDDVGSRKWDIPMTSSEDAAVDMPGRMRFADDVERKLRPRLDADPEFAGAYFDQANGGVYVVAFTRRDSDKEATLRTLVPDGRGVLFTSARYSFGALKDAFEGVWKLWPAISSGEIKSAVIDERVNQLIVGVSSATTLQRSSAQEHVSQTFGVAVSVVDEPGGVELSCTGVDSCYSPMEAGTRVRQGSTTGSVCAMAFHVTTPGGARMFLTAGHCGFYSPNTWYHKAYGYLGTEQATLYAPAECCGGALNGQDVMRVDFPDGQVSNNIFDNPQDVEGSGNPQTGEPMCVALAMSATEGCGWVEAAFASWTGDHCSCVMRGAKAESIYAINGDSGSPAYRLPDSATAIGIGLVVKDVGTPPSGHVYMTKLRDVLLVWSNWSVYTVD